MRVRLVVNPNSRRGRQYGEAVRAALQHNGVEIAGSDATGSIDAIVVAGGDGTLSHCIAEALARRVPVGLVPLGTFNDLARSLAIPHDVEAACAVIAAGRTRAIDVASVNGFSYLTEASIGLSSRVARLMKPEERRRFGLGAILLALFRALAHVRPFHVEITRNGAIETIRTVQVTVANSYAFGGFITVDDAALDDGLLDCYIVEALGWIPLTTVLRAVMGRRRPQGGGVRSFRAAELRIVTHRPRRLTADGEPAGYTPADFTVLPQRLEIFVPSP